MADENRVQLGRVVPNYLGDWSSTKSYSKLDSVVYNSVGYIANKDVAAGVVPGTDSASWSVTNRGAIGPKGDKGDKGDQGIQGPMGPQGERGKQIFKSSTEYYEPNSLGHWWSDLSPAVSSDNPPKVGDTIINSSGNIFQINTVNAGDGGGGGTFGVGVVLGNITGPQGPKGDMDLSQITVGGRNLYLNSRVLSDGYGVNGTATVTLEPFDSTTNMWHFVAAQGSGKAVGIYLYNYVNGKIPDNSDWSYSADVKGIGKLFKFGVENTSTDPDLVKGIVGNDWSRISRAGHVNESNIKTLVMYFDTTDSPLDVYIKLPKLEVGNIPTDWTPAPEDVSPKLTIGGRNYLLNSSGDTLSGWGKEENTWSVTADSTRGNVFTFTPTTTWTGGGANSISQPVNAKIIGKQVTISFLAKSSVNGAALHSEPQGGVYLFDTTLTTDWIKYSYTINSVTDKIYLMAVEAGKTYYLDDIKLEVGNIPTDWTPAPEDVPSNDAQLVHKTGNETVAGDKTLTGKLTATNIVETGAPLSVSTTTTFNGLTFSFTRVGNSVYVTTSTTTIASAIQVGSYNGIIPSGYRPINGVELAYLQKPSAAGFVSAYPSGGGYFNAALAVGDKPRIVGYYPTIDPWPAN